jgi:hypothetical protein
MFVYNRKCHKLNIKNSDSIATGLINALLNSGTEAHVEQGLILKKKLDRYCKHRGGVKKHKKDKKDKKRLKNGIKKL